MAHIATVKIGMLDCTFPVILTVQVWLEDMLFNEEKKEYSQPHTRGTALHRHVCMLALIDRLLYIETQFTRKLKRGHYKHWNQGPKDPRTGDQKPKDPRTGDQKPKDPRTQGPKDWGPETQGPEDPRTRGPGNQKT